MREVSDRQIVNESCMQMISIQVISIQVISFQVISFQVISVLDLLSAWDGCRDFLSQGSFRLSDFFRLFVAREFQTT
jgi:hypothetical protein